MTDDRDAMRKTILARIATRDTSIPNPTPEQFAETTRLLEGVLKSLGGKHKDYALMLKLLKDLRTRKGCVEAVARRACGRRHPFTEQKRR